MKQLISKNHHLRSLARHSLRHFATNQKGPLEDGEALDFKIPTFGSESKPTSWEG
jgi:hypothetical protein